MTTQKQRDAARRNLAKARRASTGKRGASSRAANSRSDASKDHNGAHPAMGRQRRKPETHVYH